MQDVQTHERQAHERQVHESRAHESQAHQRTTRPAANPGRPQPRASRPARHLRTWHAGMARVRGFAAHPDPLVEASNWVALTIGSHLPFWPLYVWWAAGDQSFPSALLTVALAPVFLAIPLLSRRSGLLGRAATPLVGLANTVFTIWVLGMASGTALFLAPCAALAALLFRRAERWLMLALTALPLLVWYALLYHPPVPLHRYGGDAAQRLFGLNAISISVLISLFGWFQVSIYQRMERR